MSTLNFLIREEHLRIGVVVDAAPAFDFLGTVSGLYVRFRAEESPEFLRPKEPSRCLGWGASLPLSGVLPGFLPGAEAAQDVADIGEPVAPQQACCH